ncbi:MAG: hypothetical protein WCW93_00545 [Candidatus Paceibacterota bacterium]
MENKLNNIINFSKGENLKKKLKPKEEPRKLEDNFSSGEVISVSALKKKQEEQRKEKFKKKLEKFDDFVSNSMNPNRHLKGPKEEKIIKVPDSFAPVHKQKVDALTKKQIIDEVINYDKNKEVIFKNLVYYSILVKRAKEENMFPEMQS